MSAELQQPARYDGEPARRSPFVACLMTAICPGLGAAYLGRPLRGLLTSLLFICGAGLFVSVWTELKFFPLLPLLVLFAGWVVVVSLLGFDAMGAARRHGDRYILKGSNHLVVYVAIFLVAYALPLLGLVHYTSTTLWTLVWVRGDSMYPTLVEGDLLLVDRTAYREEGPRPGDLVLFREDVDGDLLLGRVIAIPNDEIGIQDGSPSIEGAPLPRLMLTGLEHGISDALPALPEESSVFQGVVSYTEVNRDAGYLVAETSTTRGTVFAPFRLDEREYYVLFDNRGRFGDSRELGPVGRAQILGEALFIAFSKSQNHVCPPPFPQDAFVCEGPVRWNRVARRTEPTPTSF